MDDYQGNFLRALQGGYNFGQQIKQQRDQTQLKGLAALAYGMPRDQRQGHLSELAKLSPEFAQAQQKNWNAEDDRDQQELIGYARFIKNAPPEQQQAAYTNYVLPKLRARGMQAPDWTQDTQDTILKTVNALTQWDTDPSDTPSGYREFELLTNAAGYEPGSDEYRKAAGTKLGTIGRASNAGYGFFEIEGPDGRKRMGRNNPRTGVREIYDEGTGDFVQIGSVPGAGSGGGGSQFPTAPGRPTTPAEDARFSERMNGIVRRLQERGFTPAQIEAALPAFEEAENQAAGAVMGDLNNPASMPTRPRPAPFGAGPGRTKEEEAAAVRDAEIRTDLNYADQRATTEAEAAARKKAAEAEATRVAEARTTYSQVENNASQMLALIDQARSHPGRAVATGLSGTLDPRNRIDGTNARDFRVLMDQMQGKSFLEAFNSLRGGGQITEAEGRKATEAIGRLNTAQSDQAFFAALNELEQVILLGMERAKKATQPRAESGAGWSIIKKGP